MASNIISLKATDGSTVEFIDDEPMRGGVKDVYWSPRKDYVVAFFRRPLDPIGRERIEKIVGSYRDNIFYQEGGEYWKKVFCWPEKIVDGNGTTGIVVPTYDKRFFFTSEPYEGVEKEGKWFASAKLFNRLPPEERGSLANFFHICLCLSRGTRRLHAAGLAHSDLSYKNCLVDPVSGSACIIDLDGLVVPNLYPPDVLGTPDFIAPEVLRSFRESDVSRRVLPSRETDLHALAVLIYIYLTHRHPLRGSKVYSLDVEEQEYQEMGEKALFIENPNDRSNRYVVRQDDQALLPWCDCDGLPYEVLGPSLVELFNRAFIDGLSRPQSRPSAGDWEDAIVRTTDLILRCSNPSCPKKWFVFLNNRVPVCPYCHTPHSGSFPILDFYVKRAGSYEYRLENRRLVVWDGLSLYKWHADRTIAPNEKVTEDDARRLGYFQLIKNRWCFVNERAVGMTNVTDNQRVPTASEESNVAKRVVVLRNNLDLAFQPDDNGRLARVRIVEP